MTELDPVRQCMVSTNNPVLEVSMVPFRKATMPPVLERGLRGVNCGENVSSHKDEGW